MATSRGADEVRAYIARTQVALATNILRGAARAAAKIVADEAKDRVISSDVRGAIKVATRASDEQGRVIAKVQVKGKGAYIAPWLEYGTDPHFISVDDSQRQGLSVGRVNTKVKEGSLVIGGNFVGATVLHPGARPHPFLRPALDVKQDEAIAAAQAYINTRLRQSTGGAAEVDE
ncbi:HK97 gp10 family phage protein [Erythrobacteraceae bacterium CFH 75059]|uniref:HK97 gp10 family phage protein n=1 Tax=Qipengyuania thermophila TaxID=2509361 RepID=UPI0010226606|nr:HK97 gp10 family phage protein [Qipengyuania thermophila]TCD04274.1 HK97 gp10 family phage protein [Erythrobacteraceae bacterium CFH 75059]